MRDATHVSAPRSAGRGPLVSNFRTELRVQTDKDTMVSYFYLLPATVLRTVLRSRPATVVLRSISGEVMRWHGVL